MAVGQKQQLIESAHAPLWDGYMADPLVLRTKDCYYAYGTDGPSAFARKQSGREFPILQSFDLQSWTFVGGALQMPDGLRSLAYWAPEVAESGGVYYMFYSAGANEGQDHKIRVATSEKPEGPFVGGDRPLIHDEPFSIDAHAFRDPQTGNWYLFFAKDYFDEPVGTGIAVVPMNDLGAVGGAITPLLRAQSDWQIYERDRFWYDRRWPVWYCVEGPFVVFRQNKYWMFYSGGNWHAEHYGIGCAVADQVTGPYVDARVQQGASVLKTGDGLYGPGHCSIVVGPDGEDRICYHAWDSEYKARQMHLRSLKWTSDGPMVVR